MRTFLILLLAGGFYSQLSAAELKVGDKVQCNWKKGGVLYKGTITSKSGNNIHVNYDDGDQEDTTADMCKPVASAGSWSALKVGDRVRCNWKKGGTMYPGKITSKSGNNVHIAYDDGDQEDTTIDMCTPE